MKTVSQSNPGPTPIVGNRITVLASLPVWTLIGVLFTFQSYADVIHYKVDFSLVDTFIWLMPQWLIWFGLTFVVAKLGQRFPLRKPLLVQRFFLHLVFCVTIAFFHLLLDAPLQMWLRPPIEAIGVWEGVVILITKKFHTNIIIYWAILGAFHAIHYYRELEHNTLRSAQLKHELALTQLDALKSKLQPHFLFNTLNSISSLMYTDLENADSMLAALSRFLRRILDAPQRQLFTLAEELDFLNAYLEIEAFRFGDRLTVTRQLDPKTFPCYVPSFCLQPLVENALNHGIEKRPGSGELTLAARLTASHLQLEVWDNGPGAPESDFSAQNGLGIQVTRDRLEKLFSDRAHIEFESSEELGTRVTLELPIVEDPSTCTGAAS